MTDQTPTRPDGLDGLIERLNDAAMVGDHGNAGVMLEAAQALSYLRWVEGRAVEVLEPFAEVAAGLEEYPEDGELSLLVCSYGEDAGNIAIASFRRASAFSHELRGDNQKAGEQP